MEKQKVKSYSPDNEEDIPPISASSSANASTVEIKHGPSAVILPEGNHQLKAETDAEPDAEPDAKPDAKHSVRNKEQTDKKEVSVVVPYITDSSVSETQKASTAIASTGPLKREASSSSISYDNETTPVLLKKHKSTPSLKAGSWRTSPPPDDPQLGTASSFTPVSTPPSKDSSGHVDVGSKSSTSPPSSASLNRPVRQRIAIACSYCRRRKIKCFGFDASVENSKCANCKRFNQECVFTPVSSVAAPLKNISRQSAGWNTQANVVPRRAVSVQYPTNQYQGQIPGYTESQQQHQQQQHQQHQQHQQQQQIHQQHQHQHQQQQQHTYYWQERPPPPPPPPPPNAPFHQSQGQMNALYSSTVPPVQQGPPAPAVQSAMPGIYVPHPASGQGRIYLPIPPPQLMTASASGHQMMLGQPGQQLDPRSSRSPAPSPSVHYSNQQGQQPQNQPLPPPPPPPQQQHLTHITMVQGTPIAGGPPGISYTNVPSQIQYATTMPHYSQQGFPSGYGEQYIYQGAPRQGVIVQSAQVTEPPRPPPPMITSAGPSTSVPVVVAANRSEEQPSGGDGGASTQKKLHIQDIVNK